MNIEQIRQKFLDGIKLFDKIAIEQNIEIWKNVKGYKNYCVSNLGRVNNIATGKILKPWIDSTGYYRIDLTKIDKRYKFLVSRLVALAFLENPLNKKNVDHKNNVRLNNNVNNLRWVSPKENNQNKSMSKNNSSGYKGVSWDKKNKKWNAYIALENGIRKNLGYFKNIEDAKDARQKKAKEIHGEFLNDCEK